jgi:excisionase family DNA binding protein
MEMPAVMAARRGAAAGPTPEPREWMTLAEAAARAGVHVGTLRRAALVGNLEAQRSGKVWLTTEAHVRAWLRAARHRPGPRPGQGRGRPRPPKTPPDATAPEAGSA